MNHADRPASGQTSPTSCLLIAVHSPGPEIHVSDCALRSLSGRNGCGEGPEAIMILCSQVAGPDWRRPEVCPCGAGSLGNVQEDRR